MVHAYLVSSESGSTLFLTSLNYTTNKITKPHPTRQWTVVPGMVTHSESVCMMIFGFLWDLKINFISS